MHGRPLTAQISVLAGIPVAWGLFMAAPPEAGAFYYYLFLMVTLGLTATWCGSAVNLPILAEIVKPGNRATIMAWEGALEGSCSVIFGNAMVSFLAATVFGYDLDAARGSEVERDPANVRALGNALMLVSFCPWIVCFCFYSILHWSYPRDLRRLGLAGSYDGDATEDKCVPNGNEGEAEKPSPELTKRSKEEEAFSGSRPSLSQAAAQVVKGSVVSI